MISIRPEKNGNDTEGLGAIWRKPPFQGLVVKFLLGWIASVFLIACVALLHNADWCRPQYEAALSDIFHRKIKLGHINWSLGLNGLAISANKIEAFEQDGTPFFMSGRSEIGIAFLPLFTGEVIIHHLDFQKPEIWAVKLPGGKWNFDDLIKEGPDIRIIQLTRGRLHIKDETRLLAGGKAPEMVMDDLKLKFVFPKKKRSKPFFLEMTLKRPEYTSTFELSGLGVGALEDWHKNTYKFEARAKKVNPDDMETLIAYFDARAAELKTTDIGGLFNVSLKGEGTFEKGLHATAEMDVEGLVVSDPQLGQIKAPRASSQARLIVDKDLFQWKEMSLNLANITLKSEGRLSKWQDGGRNYSAQISGKMDDLQGLGSLIGRRDKDAFPVGITFMNDMKAERLRGKAEITINIEGNKERAEIESRIKAGGVALRDLLEHATTGSARLLVLAGIPDAADVKGDVKVVPGEKVNIRDGEVDVPAGTLKLSGSTDLKSDISDYDVQIGALSLDEVEHNLNKSANAHLELSRVLSLPPKSKVDLAGVARVEAHVRRRGTRPSFELKTTLNNAAFALQDKSLTLSKLTGTVAMNDRQTTFQKLSGKIGDGDFSLEGTLPASIHAPVDLTVKGSRIDLDQVHRALKLFKIDMPIVKEDDLRGRLKEVALKIQGSAKAPRLTLEAVPEDIQYKAIGGMKPVRVTGGNISLKDDQLKVKDAVLGLRGSSVVTTLTADNISKSPQVKEVEIKSQGLDLADVEYYVCSPIFPQSLRKQYEDALSEYNIDNVKGKIYGDMTLTPIGQKLKLDGVVGLMNVSAAVGKPAINVDRLTGVVAATGQELLLQNIAGQVNGSQFTFDGYINRYGTPKMQWTIDLFAGVQSREIMDLMRLAFSQETAENIKVVCQGPVEVKAKIEGTLDSSAVTFRLKADRYSNVALVGPFGTVHQPAGESLSIDGSLTSTAKDLVIKDAHIFIGQSVLNTSGTVGWGKKPVINLVVNSPNPVPGRKVVAAVSPDLVDDKTNGLVDISLKVHGPLSHPKFEGFVAMDRLSVPRLNIYDATGKLSTTEAFDPRSGKDPFSSRLNLSSLKLGYMVLRDLTGDVSLRPVKGQFKTPKLRITNGKAVVAGGKLNFSAVMDLDEQKLATRAKLEGVRAGEISGWLLGHGGEITGIADAEIAFKSEGRDRKDLIAHMEGKGRLVIKNGTVARFSHLQQRLTQANLLQQGVLGFNFNNLLQSVVPVRTGNFNELSANFRMEKGVTSIKELRFNGDDMRLWGAGTADLNSGALAIEIAGTIPRVQSSIIGGPIGKVSKRITIQKLLNTVTFGKLETLPPLPVLGDLASDKPRTFTFNVAAPLEEPKVVAQSIEKSFKWLPSKPLASAHPVIGMDLN